MAYTVKQVATMSKVSVRTLHFYDELGLLKPAYCNDKGYRFYEEPQLLMLQQILFYRELGFDLKQIKRTLERADFEKAEALQSHREILQRKIEQTRTLIETIDKTIRHVKGAKKMKTREMFVGFSVGVGKDRFDERVELGGETNHCKVSGRDTQGAVCVFEFTGGGGGPRHLHHEQDEWVYVLEGKFDFEVGGKRFRLSAGESVFIPRKVAHAWVGAGAKPGKLIDVYQPAGTIEEFFRELGKFNGPYVHEVLTVEEIRRLFREHGLDVVGPPIKGKWKVDEGGKVKRIA